MVEFSSDDSHALLQVVETREARKCAQLESPTRGVSVVNAYSYICIISYLVAISAQDMLYVCKSVLDYQP